jgi:hypothetical protein
MKKLFALMITVIAVVAFAFAGSALASGGVSIEQGNDWNVFQPNPVNPGDQMNVSITTFQDESEGAYATITFTGLKAAGLTLVGNSDSSALCVEINLNKTVCYYSDFAHSAKSDSFTFAVSDTQAPGTYTIKAKVVVEDVGSAQENLDYTTPIPVVAPIMTIAHDSAIWLCDGSATGDLDTYAAADALQKVQQGYFEPVAVEGTVDGQNNIGGFHLACSTTLTDTGLSLGDGGDVFGADYGPAQEELGFYSIVG